MKFTFQRNIYFLIFGMVLLFACNKDEDLGEVYPVIHGSFQVDGKTFATNYATLTDDALSRKYDTIILLDTVINGKDTTVQEHEIITEWESCNKLVLSNVRPDSAAKDIYSISFYVWFPDADLVGIFTYDYLSFDDKTYNAGWNFSNPRCTYTNKDGAVKYSDCTSGTFSIERMIDSSYTFTYNLVFAGNKRVTGNYNGALLDRTNKDKEISVK